MRRTALLGYTGFVGSTLCKSREFSQYYNSKNIDQICGQSFDQIVIAAAPAEKWKANQNAAADLENINRLIGHLKQVKATQAVLISTVDVYPSPIDVTEDTPINLDECHPYGCHRLMLEQAVSDLFSAQIIRLPGLFGDGLKKNVIFDYLSNNEVHKIDTRSRFQFYNMARLSDDLDRFLDHKGILNIAVEPVSVSQVAEICWQRPHENHVLETPALYDVRSIHAGEAGYMYSAQQCISDMSVFAESWRSNAR